MLDGGTCEHHPQALTPEVCTVNPKCSLHFVFFVVFFFRYFVLFIKVFGITFIPTPLELFSKAVL